MHLSQDMQPPRLPLSFALSLLAPVALAAPGCFTPGANSEAEADTAGSETSPDGSGDSIDGGATTSGADATDPDTGDTSATGDTSGPGETSATGDTSVTVADTGSSGEDSGTGREDDTTASDTSGASECGDGEVTQDEVCDDGTNDGAYGGCTVDCSAFGPFCGDGEATDAEVCDDGNDLDGDGCNVDCIASGTPLMTINYDSPAHDDDAAQAVIIDSTGSIIVAGYETRADLSQGRNLFLRKYGEDGAVTWTRTYNGVANGSDLGRGIAVDAEDNIAVNGYTTRTDLSQGLNTLTLLYAPNGDLVDSAEFNNSSDSDDVGHGVGFDDDGNVYVGGYETRTDLGESYNMRVIKYDDNLDTVWSSSFNNANDGQDRCRDFRVDPEGFSVCAGYEHRADLEEGFNHLIVKYDPSGGEVWAQTSHNPLGTEDTLWAAALGGAGEVVVGGRERRPDLGQGYNIFVRKYDADGNTLWSRTHNGEADGDDYCEAVAVDGNGNVLAAGRVTTAGSDVGAWVSKYDPAGNELWTDIHQGSAGEIDYALALDTYPDGRVVAVGYEDRSDQGLGLDMWVRVYAP